MFKIKETCIIVMKYNIFISKLYLNFSGPETEIIPYLRPASSPVQGFAAHG